MGANGGTHPAEAGWDFFLSYTKGDRAWAEWVAWQLEDAGYRVLLQAWDFVPGTHWTIRMQEGVAGAEHTLAILSQAYLKSVYGRTEWQAAYRADPEGPGRKLIPIRVEECGRPGLLGEVVSFDLFDCPEADIARRRLLEEITAARSGRAKPPSAPDFPGSAAGAALIGPSALRPPQQAPPSTAPAFPAARSRRSRRRAPLLGAVLVIASMLVLTLVSVFTDVGFGLLDLGEPTPSSPPLRTLGPDQKLLSPKGTYALFMQGDGNLLVVNGPGRVLWSSSTCGGTPGSSLRMDEDGNLEIFGPEGGRLWESGTEGHPGAHFEMRDDGDFAVVDTRGMTLWSTGPARSVLKSGETLLPAHALVSPDGRFEVMMQCDGNVIVSGGVVWTTKTEGNGGAVLEMQADGNLAVLRGRTHLWDSKTYGHAGSGLEIGDDGVMAIYMYDPERRKIWSSAYAS
jgi:hypothetical protein